MKKYIIVSIIILILGWLLGGYFDNSFQERNSWSVNIVNTNEVKTTTQSGASNQESITDLPISDPLLKQDNTFIENDRTNLKPHDGWDPRLTEDYKNWQRSRGYFSEVDLQEYKGFKLDKLEELANQGDLKAIEVLTQFEASSSNWARHRELLELGTVYGSLKSLNRLAIEKVSQYIGSKKEEDALEMLAYRYLEGKRGDLYIKDKIPLELKILKFSPTPEQQIVIERRADELMADLENKRKILGLPPFDNTPEKSDKEYYDMKAQRNSSIQSH